MNTLQSTPDAKPALAALLDVHGVAGMCTCSPMHIRRLADAAKMPPPVRLGSLVRWRRTDIEKWLADRCPPCRERGRR